MRRKDQVGTHDVIVRPTRCQWRQEALPWFYLPSFFGLLRCLWAGLACFRCPHLGDRWDSRVLEIRVWVVPSGTYIRNKIVTSGLQGELSVQKKWGGAMPWLQRSGTEYVILAGSSIFESSVAKSRFLLVMVVFVARAARDFFNKLDFWQLKSEKNRWPAGAWAHAAPGAL